MTATDTTSAAITVDDPNTGFFSHLIKVFIAVSKDDLAETARKFWGYAEAIGKADNSSFKDIL